jgi:AcrR family transcriptional regulator
MSPKPDVSAERRQQIFEAALACFSRKGYHLTTMDDIADESGLSKGSLYWYFKGKKGLFLALFKEVMDQISQGWESLVADDGAKAADQLQASLAFFRSELREMIPLFGIMMEGWALTRLDQDVEQLIRELYRPFLEMMKRIIETGISQAEFEAADPEATALVVLTLLDGIMLALGTGLGAYEWDKVMDAAESLVLNGLRVREG